MSAAGPANDKLRSMKEFKDCNGNPSKLIKLANALDNQQPEEDTDSEDPSDEESELGQNEEEKNDLKSKSQNIYDWKKRQLSSSYKKGSQKQNELKSGAQNPGKTILNLKKIDLKQSRIDETDSSEEEKMR